MVESAQRPPPERRYRNLVDASRVSSPQARSSAVCLDVVLDSALPAPRQRIWNKSSSLLMRQRHVATSTANGKKKHLRRGEGSRKAAAIHLTQCIARAGHLTSMKRKKKTRGLGVGAVAVSTERSQCVRLKNHVHGARASHDGFSFRLVFSLKKETQGRCVWGFVLQYSCEY